jgi:hypothetical protein
MSVHLFFQIGERHFISLEYFFTVIGVPVAGDSYWSSKRMYAAAIYEYLQILQ